MKNGFRFWGLGFGAKLLRRGLNSETVSRSYPTSPSTKTEGIATVLTNRQVALQHLAACLLPPGLLDWFLSAGAAELEGQRLLHH